MVRRADAVTEIGGITLPSTAIEKPQQGVILMVGKGRLTEGGKIVPLEVKIGDFITFAKYAGVEVDYNGERVLIIREDDIIIGERESVTAIGRG